MNIMGKTKIEWTEASWNPVTGCTRISDGCRHCYAERFARRLQAMGQEKYRSGFEVTLHYESLKHPLGWVKPQMIFVCSMSDLFHDSVPTDYIQKVFFVMGQASRHTFQILTKRADRLLELSPILEWTENIWAGVTVENAAYVERVEQLQCSGAKVKFLSLEPLLGPINSLNLSNIDWVIVGGESGPGARPMNPEWVTSIRDTCLDTDVPFFFKQWGGTNKKKSGRILEGRTWDDRPLAIQTGLASC